MSVELRNLYRCCDWNILPPFTKEEKENKRKEWNLKFDIANYFGISDEDIENQAKEEFKDFVKKNRGCGFVGNETWEECGNERKYYIVGSLLPSIEVWTNKNSKKLEAEYVQV